VEEHTKKSQFELGSNNYAIQSKNNLAWARLKNTQN